MKAKEVKKILRNFVNTKFYIRITGKTITVKYTDGIPRWAIKKILQQNNVPFENIIIEREISEDFDFWIKQELRNKYIFKKHVGYDEKYLEQYDLMSETKEYDSECDICYYYY